MAEEGFFVESGIVSRKPRLWKPKKPLKEIIMESRDPRLSIYRELLKTYPDLSNAKLRDILTECDPERLRKILTIVKHSGRKEILNEYLDAPSDSRILEWIDQIYSYYIFKLPNFERLKPNLEDDHKVEWNYNINGKRYRGMIWMICDRHCLPLKLWEGFSPSSQPIIGVHAQDLPCFQNLEKSIRELGESIAQNPFNREKIRELNSFLEDWEKAKEKLAFQIKPESLPNFPPKYTKNGLFLHRFTRRCDLCKKEHEYWIILKLKRKRFRG